MADYLLTLDAINFGSGWFPTLRKRAGCSGYFTVACGAGRPVARAGPWSNDELWALTRPRSRPCSGRSPITS